MFIEKKSIAKALGKSLEKVMEDTLLKTMLVHKSPSAADCSRLRLEKRTITPGKVLDTDFSQASFTTHCWRQRQDGLFASSSAAFLSFLSSETIYRAQNLWKGPWKKRQLTFWQACDPDNSG